MYLTPLKPLITTREFTDVWGGLNHNDRISDSEFYDEYGLTADAYPIVKTRDSHADIPNYDILPYTSGVVSEIYSFQEESEETNTPSNEEPEESNEEPEESVATYTLSNGSRTFFVADTLYQVLPFTISDSTKMKVMKKTYDQSRQAYVWEPISGFLKSATPPTVILMGAYVCFFPQKQYFNWQNDDDASYQTITDIDASFTSALSQSPLTVTCVKEDFTTTISPTVAATAPENPNDGAYWIDTNTKALKKFSAENSMWLSVPTSYIKLATDSETLRDFKSGDTVKITGVNALDSDVEYWHLEKVDNIVENSYVTGRYAILTAVPSVVGSQEKGNFTIERTSPDMDYVCTGQNRIWGCSNSKHEIYACKLGDPTNWSDYRGLASDSYSVTVGSAENFTGMWHTGQKVYAFKENSAVKIIGTMPSNYQTTETNTRGVAKGSHHSIAQIGDYIYYLSLDGVCRFDGSYSTLISDAFGKRVPLNGTALVHKQKYYLVAQTDNIIYTYVYDTRYGMWHVEDVITSGAEYSDLIFYTSLVVHENKIYRSVKLHNADTKNADSEVDDIFIGGDSLVPFMAQSGRLMLTLSNRGKASSLNEKYISAIIIRFRLALGSSMDISISYDGGEFTHYKHYEGTDEICKSVLRFPKGRCDYACLKFEGEGEAELISMMKLITLGSEVKHK